MEYQAGGDLVGVPPQDEPLVHGGWASLGGGFVEHPLPAAAGTGRGKWARGTAFEFQLNIKDRLGNPFGLPSLVSQACFITDPVSCFRSLANFGGTITTLH